MFRNYKNVFFIVLQGLVDANYKFICIAIGNGKKSDAKTFRYSSIFHYFPLLKYWYIINSRERTGA